MKCALALAALTLIACGGERAEPVAAPAPAPASIVAPDPPPASVAPAPECASSSDCSFTNYPLVTDASQCACPSCGPEASSLAEMDVIGEQFARFCPGYYAAHACTNPDCGHRLALCIDGRCIGEPIADSGRGEPSPCQHPGECPERVRCVTGALGGLIGCTNEMCCDSAECGNGCETDADCPECRPQCFHGGCRLPE